MPTSYTSLLGLALPVQGELQGTWGNEVNNYITSFLDAAVAGTQTLNTDADVTLTKTTGTALTGTSSQYVILNCTGSRAAARNITAPAASKFYLVINATTGGFAVTLRGAGPTTGVSIAAGERAVCAWNGSDFVKVANLNGAGSFTSLAVSGTTTLSALTASTALALNASKEVVSVTNTGTGNNVLATSPTLTTPILGTPQSVTLTNGTGLPVSTGISGFGTGVATALAVNTGASGAFVVNGGALGTPSSGTLTNATGLPLSTGVTGTLPVANGGTGLTATPTNGQLDIGNGSGFTRATLTAGSGVSISNGSGSITISATGSGGTVTSVTASSPLASSGGNTPNISISSSTGSGAVVLATSPTLTTPNLGTPSAVTLTNATGLPLSTGVTGTLAVANGGTGITSFGTGVATALGQNVTGSGGIVLAASPSLTGTIGLETVSPQSNNASSVGYTGVPQNSQSTSYTLVAADAGKSIVHPASDNNARTFTIPANGSVAFPVGTTITFINMINTVTIAITSDTMYLAGPGTTGSRTLAAYGIATAVKMTSTTWIISGNGLT
jgi:hypothetical protein